MRGLERYRALVDDWTAFADSLHRPLPATLWAHPDRVGAPELTGLLAESGLEARPLPWHPGALRLAPGRSAGAHWAHAAGLFQIQEAAAMLPAGLLGARPGERVLDLCAAPGNKTAQLALAVGAAGMVVANDPQHGRLAPLRQTIKRLGLCNVLATRRPGEEYPLAEGGFDRVLVDAPCSGEGTWRRRREPAPVADEARARLVIRQYRLLERAIALCRPGATLVYSTCTLAPEENEEVIQQLLETHGGHVELLPAEVAGFPSDPGLTHWAGRALDPSLARAMRVWPHRADTGGFFIARLRVRGSAASPAPAAGAGGAPEGADEALMERLRRCLELPAEALDGLCLEEAGGRYAHLVGCGLEPGFRPPAEFRGLPALARQMRPDKPTTAAVLALGRASRGARVHLDSPDLQRFFVRQDVRLAPGQGLAGQGYVMVWHRGHPVGLGRLRGNALESLYPRAWSPA